MSSDRVRMAKSVIATVEEHIKRNPSMPQRIRRWGIANCYKYAYFALGQVREFRLAMQAYCMMLVNDPILAIYIAVTELPFKRKLTRLLPIAMPIVPTARKFLCVHPEAGLDSPIPAITRIRQKQLAAADREMESKVFSTQTSR